MLYNTLVHIFGPLINLINGRPIIKNKEKIPAGNYILIAPHRTWMDPVLLALAVFPKKFSFMAKKELFANPVANWFLRKLNAFPVDRVHPGSSAISTPVKMLKQTDMSTIIFPSGSRYSSRLKGGAVMIAKIAGVPLVPAVYQGPLSFGALFSRKKRKINFGDPIYIDRHERLTKEKQAELEQKMQAAFDQLDQELDPSFHYDMPEKPADNHF